MVYLYNPVTDYSNKTVIIVIIIQFLVKVHKVHNTRPINRNLPDIPLTNKAAYGTSSCKMNIT